MNKMEIKYAENNLIKIGSDLDQEKSANKLNKAINSKVYPVQISPWISWTCSRSAKIAVYINLLNKQAFCFLYPLQSLMHRHFSIVLVLLPWWPDCRLIIYKISSLFVIYTTIYISVTNVEVLLLIWQLFFNGSLKLSEKINIQFS